MDAGPCYRVKWALARSARTRSIDSVTSETCLSRCLGVWDLVVLGIGSMVGSGIYVMSGIATKTQAGPSIVVSFLIAACVVLLVAACYLELASRLHKTGSTYLYVYLSVGELPAFCCGFALLVLSLFGAAINGRAFTFYLDSMLGGVISDFTTAHIVTWTIGPPIARYPDVPAVLLIAVVTLVVAVGVQCSARFTALFVCINVSVLLFVIACALRYGDLRHWGAGSAGIYALGENGQAGNESQNMADGNGSMFKSSNANPLFSYGLNGSSNTTMTKLSNAENKMAYDEYGNRTLDVNAARNLSDRVDSSASSYPPQGGFAPFGFAGMLSAASACFWAFSGFEIITCAVEEARSPRQDIPRALCGALTIVAALYLGASAALVSLVPPGKINVDAPLAAAIPFAWGQKVVGAGTLCGFTTSLLSSVYGFGRVALSMADDGLVPGWMGTVGAAGVPVRAVVMCGGAAALAALFLDMGELMAFSVDILLLLYAAVCVCVVVLRYRHPMAEYGVANGGSGGEGTNGALGSDSGDDDSVLGDAIVEAAVNRKVGKVDNDSARSPVLEQQAFLTEQDSSLDSSNLMPDLATSTAVKRLVKTGSEENGHRTEDLMSSLLDQTRVDDNFPPGSLTNVCDGDESRLIVDKQPKASKDFYGHARTGYLRDAFSCAEPLVSCAGGRCVHISLAVMVTAIAGLALCAVYEREGLEGRRWYAVASVTGAAACVVAVYTVICMHRQADHGHGGMQIPCVPLIPSIAIFFCLMLVVLNSTRASWIGTGIILCFALLMYFGYSIRHSKLNSIADSHSSDPVAAFTESQHLLEDNETESDEEEVML